MNISMNVLLVYIYNVKIFVFVYEIRDYIFINVYVLIVLYRDVFIFDLGLVDWYYGFYRGIVKVWCCFLLYNRFS